MKPIQLPARRQSKLAIRFAIGLLLALTACQAQGIDQLTPESTETLAPDSILSPVETSTPTLTPLPIQPATQTLAPTAIIVAVLETGIQAVDFPTGITIDQAKDGIQRAKLSEAKASALLEHAQVKELIAEGQRLLERLGFSSDPSQGVYARAEMIPVVQPAAQGAIRWWMAAVDAKGELLGWLFTQDASDSYTAASTPLTLLAGDLTPENARIILLEELGADSAQWTWAIVNGQLILIGEDEEGTPKQWFNPETGKFESLALQIVGNITLLDTSMTQMDAYQLAASDCRFMDAANTCPPAGIDNTGNIPETCGEVWYWSTSLLDQVAEMLDMPRQELTRYHGQANPWNNGCFALAVVAKDQWLMFWENETGQIIGVPILVNVVYIPYR